MEVVFIDTYANGYEYYGSTGLDVSNRAFLFFLIIAGVFLLIFLVIMILGVIGQWKMFKKAGKHGWEAIIPIYNIYTLCLITGVNPLWIVIVAGLNLFVFIFVPIFSIVANLATVYFFILVAVSTARSFGKEDAYALGLYFLSPFFYLALGFDKSTYLGAKPMPDVILKEKNRSSTSFSVDDKIESKDKACSNCGQQIVIDTKYCPNCGREL